MDAAKAIILAAGYGTRLRPFTAVTPKPLLPVWSEPMLARIVSLVRGWGAKDIVVNCHHLHGQIEEWCAANGCKTAFEEEILGTGGVLNPLRDWIGGDRFYLVNGDIVLEGVDSNPFAKAPRPVRGVADAGMCLVCENGPRTIEADPDGVVTCWKSPDPGAPGTFTYCGAALLDPRILGYVEPSGFSTIVEAYEKAMMDGLFVRAVNPEGMMWTDAGTVESFVAVNTSGGTNALSALPHLQAAGFGEVSRFLGARGSDRCFFEAPGRVAVVYDDSKRGENARYASHAKWLKERGAPVPDVIADAPRMKTLVLSHCGAPKKMTAAMYASVARALARFNALDPSGLDLEPEFDAALFKWERDLFAEHCLGTRFGMEMPREVEAELEKTAEALEREPSALVHRDFQSENILWKDGRFSFIDFQGMRKGPAAYDLASLVFDPYADMPEETREATVREYAAEAGRPGIAKILPFAAVERLVQCLGAYGRLASVGQTRFSKYVLPALENLLAAADEAGLDATGALAEELVARETRRAHHDCGRGGRHGEDLP